MIDLIDFNLFFFSDCTNEIDCLKCNSNGCIKCRNFILHDDRRCVDECPRGYIEQWSSLSDLMGRVCRTNGYSDPMLATIVGLTIGSIICLLMLVLGVVMIKRKHRRKTLRNTMVMDTIEREEFIKQLEELRPSSHSFLAMLNDTRCQIRKLYLSGDLIGANSYRSIVRDLAKLLILLNKPVQVIAQPPQDWHRLYIWALHILDRYKPQIAQLIDFLQSPVLGNDDDDDTQNSCRLGSSQYSTFKSTNTMNTAISTDSKGMAHHQLQLFGSLISLHEFEEPRTSNAFSRSSCNTLKSNYPSSDINGSSLWLEDEFFKLGFRPQDEITTEL